MKIKSVRIQNFRSFHDETIAFDNYTCLVGSNGSGKSNVLCALNVFFRETADSANDLTQLQEEDFHNKNISEPARITVTFDSLSTEAKEDFRDYVRQDELVVTAEASFDQAEHVATVKQFGQRKGMLLFAPFFKAHGDGRTVKELKDIYASIRKAVPDLPGAGTKDAMASALREYEASRPESCELLASEDQFYGVSKGANRMEKYIQWVYVPAVKDATTEQIEAKNTALGKLLARTVRANVDFDSEIAVIRESAQRQYSEAIRSKQGALNRLSESLHNRLVQWAHPGAVIELVWQQDSGDSIRVQDPVAEIVAGESGFKGNLSRFGHGFQRSYLIALLQELATGSAETGPRLLLACEEPELYQHPPQARHLAEVLEQLSAANSQVLVCTHSPYFISGQQFESVRFVRKTERSFKSVVKAVTVDALGRSIASARGGSNPKPTGVLVKINQALQPSLNEIFFTPALVLVEGLEDVAYITTYLHLMGSWDECRRLGVHIVPANGKSHIIEPLAATTLIGIPTFVVFDSDAHDSDPDHRVKHANDNKAILRLRGFPDAEALPVDHFWTSGCVMWASEMGTSIDSDFSSSDLSKFKEAARSQCGQVANLAKNTLFIAAYLTTAWENGARSKTLEKLCYSLIDFARAASKS